MVKIKMKPSSIMEGNISAYTRWLFSSMIDSPNILKFGLFGHLALGFEHISMAYEMCKFRTLRREQIPPTVPSIQARRRYLHLLQSVASSIPPLFSLLLEISVTQCPEGTSAVSLF